MIGRVGALAPCCFGEHSGIRPLFLVLAPLPPSSRTPPCLPLKLSKSQTLSPKLEKAQLEKAQNKCS